MSDLSPESMAIVYADAYRDLAIMRAAICRLKMEDARAENVALKERIRDLEKILRVVYTGWDDIAKGTKDGVKWMAPTYRGEAERALREDMPALLDGIGE